MTTDSHSKRLEFSTRVKALLANRSDKDQERHDNPSSLLSEIIGVSASTARRILDGEGDKWELVHLEKIEAYFGVEILVFNKVTEVDIQEGTLVIGDKQIQCYLHIGAALLTTSHQQYVAVQTPNGWSAIEPTQAAGVANAYKIEEISIIPKGSSLPSIAILDDSNIAADTLTEYLNHLGFNALAFYDTQSLASAMQTAQFNCFVLDWLIKKNTVESLIESIRKTKGPEIPIFVLTGTLMDGTADAQELAERSLALKFELKEKPPRFPLLAAEIIKALELR